MSKSVLFILTFLIISCSAKAQRDYMRIVEWNVENLFDCQHDTLKDDMEFTPEGPRQWTKSRYWKKINDIGRVICAIGGDCPPALIGLCEVENDSVMTTLTRHGILWSLGYEYIVTDSPDSRGIDVALMYQPEMFAPMGHESIRVPSAEHGYKATRDLLHAWGTLPWGDTLHVVLCHLPSRAGNTREGDLNRALAAKTLKTLTDSLFSINPNMELVVMGDFNANPNDPIFSRWIRPFLAKKGTEEMGLYTLTPQQKNPSVGTYYYQHFWEWIDHILVSQSLIQSDYQAQIYYADWMIERDKHNGWHPRHTYQGPAYKGGVSDHLPIYFDLRANFSK